MQKRLQVVIDVMLGQASISLVENPALVYDIQPEPNSLPITATNETYGW